MRTTVTLDPDAAALVRRLMEDRGVSFKEAVNQAIRAGLGGTAGHPAETPTFPMGRPTVPLQHALRLAAGLDSEETSRELEAGT